jgi:hypothetical protein
MRSRPEIISPASAAGLGGKTPGDVPGLVSQAKPQETTYVNALNACAE